MHWKKTSKNFPKCSLVCETWARLAFMKQWRRMISCSVGSLAFINSIAFVFPEKLHINSLRPSASYLVIGKRQKNNFPNLKRNKGTVGRRSEWWEIEWEAQPGMMLSHANTPSDISSAAKFSEQPYTRQNTNNNHRKVSHQGQMKSSRENKNRQK